MIGAPKVTGVAAHASSQNVLQGQPGKSSAAGYPPIDNPSYLSTHPQLDAIWAQWAKLDDGGALTPWNAL
jgi:hypothetical protein